MIRRGGGGVKARRISCVPGLSSRHRPTRLAVRDALLSSGAAFQEIPDPFFFRHAHSAKLRLGALSTRAFEANIRRDIIGACHESEYADVYPPSLNTQMASWYLRGHFPCGYEGHWPSGKLVVY